MSHSYFTRFLGLVIVAVVCAPLFLMGTLPQMIGYQLLLALPLLAAFFMWSGTRATPVFDDEAFHRTLPPRDGAVFLRLLRLPLGVAGGIVLVVLGYGIYCGFGWRTLLFGSVFLAAPVSYLLAGCGVAAAAATGRNERNGLRVLAWAAVLATPLISILLLNSILSEKRLESARWLMWPYYGPRFLLAGLLYLPAWWLVVAQRKRAWGVGLAAVTGLALPWLWLQDALRQIPEGLAAYAGAEPPKAAVQVTRKALPVLPDGTKSYPLDQVFDVKGLAKDELLVTGQVSVGAWPKMREDFSIRDGWDGTDGTEHLVFGVSRADRSHGVSIREDSVEAAQADDGGMRWGSEAVFEILRRGLPAGVILKHSDETRETSAPLTLDGQTGWDGLGGTEPSKPWLMEASLLKFGKPVVFDAAKGGRVRLEGGGWLQLKAMSGTLNLWTAKSDLAFPGGDPWFHLFRQTAWQSNTPFVVLVNEAENEAFLVDEIGSQWDSPAYGRSGYLGITRWFSIGEMLMKPGTSKEMMRRYHLLSQCKVYVFWPQSIRLPKWTLEAGK